MAGSDPCKRTWSAADTVIKTISEYSLGSSIPFSGAVWRRAPRPSFRRMLSQIRENHTRFFSLPWTTPPPPGAAPLPASPMRKAPLLPSLKRTRRVDFFRVADFSFLLPPPACWLAVRPHRHSRSPPPMVPRGRGRGAGQLVRVERGGRKDDEVRWMPAVKAVSSPTQLFHCGRIAHELSWTKLMKKDKN